VTEFLKEPGGKPSSSRLNATIAAWLAFAIILVEVAVRAILAITDSDANVIIARWEIISGLLGYSGVSWFKKLIFKEKTMDVEQK